MSLLLEKEMVLYSQRGGIYMKDNKALKVTCIVVIALLLVATLALTMLKNYLMLDRKSVV